MTDDVRIIEGDCLAVLPTLPDGCVDAVVTDPPYGQTNEAYDKAGGWVTFSLPLWRELYRVAADNAAVLAFCGNPTYHRMAWQAEQAGWKVRQMWAWVYRDGMITSAYPREGFDRLAPAMDPIMFATKGKVLLNLEREGEAWECWFDRSGPNYSDRSSDHSSRRQKAGGHWPRSVVASEGDCGFQYFQLSRGADRAGRVGHPNQKPTSLMQWLVSKVPGGTILDPFAGSGTTGVAALLEGRKAILIEREPAYVEIIRKRIAEATPPLFRQEAATP